MVFLFRCNYISYDEEVKYMLGIIIFVIWYLTIGVIQAIYNYINFPDSWNALLDRMFNETNIPRTQDAIEWGNTVIGAFVILFWMPVLIRNIITLIKKR